MYAVKVLRSRYSNPKATDAKTGKSNKPFIELFRREGEIGIQLKHPNIVEIHEIYSHGLTHYLVMEFIEGQNLREFYRARRRLRAARGRADHGRRDVRPQLRRCSRESRTAI